MRGRRRCPVPASWTARLSGCRRAGRAPAAAAWAGCLGKGTAARALARPAAAWQTDTQTWSYVYVNYHLFYRAYEAHTWFCRTCMHTVGPQAPLLSAARTCQFRSFSGPLVALGFIASYGTVVATTSAAPRPSECVWFRQAAAALVLQVDSGARCGTSACWAAPALPGL